MNVIVRRLLYSRSEMNATTFTNRKTIEDIARNRGWIPLSGRTSVDVILVKPPFLLIANSTPVPAGIPESEHPKHVVLERATECRVILVRDWSTSDAKTIDDDLRSPRPDDVILVGQAPSRSGSSRRPLEGPALRRLARWSGIPYSWMVDRTKRINLVGYFPGRTAGGGDRFPLSEARSNFRRYVPYLEGRTVVALGKAVATVMSLADLPPYRWTIPKWSTSTVAAWCPHPSGASRFWNDPRNREIAGAFFAGLFRCPSGPNE